MACGYPTSVRRYIGVTVAEMVEAGWSVRFEADEYVYTDPGDLSLESRTTGFVSECPIDGMSLTIAIDRDVDLWLASYVHEFGHFQQWRDLGQRAYRRKTDRYAEAMRRMEQWTKKRKRFTQRQLWGAARTIVEDEADAEARAIRDIKHYNLPIDLDDYIKQANAYLLAYAYMVSERRCPDPHVTVNGDIWPYATGKMDLIKNSRKTLRQEYEQVEGIFVEHANKEG